MDYLGLDSSRWCRCHASGQSMKLCPSLTDSWTWLDYLVQDDHPPFWSISFHGQGRILKASEYLCESMPRRRKKWWFIHMGDIGVLYGFRVYFTFIHMIIRLSLIIHIVTAIPSRRWISHEPKGARRKSWDAMGLESNMHLQHVRRLALQDVPVWQWWTSRVWQNPLMFGANRSHKMLDMVCGSLSGWRCFACSPETLDGVTLWVDVTPMTWPMTSHDSWPIMWVYIYIIHMIYIYTYNHI